MSLQMPNKQPQQMEVLVLIRKQWPTSKSLWIFVASTWHALFLCTQHNASIQYFMNNWTNFVFIINGPMDPWNVWALLSLNQNPWPNKILEYQTIGTRFLVYLLSFDPFSSWDYVIYHFYVKWTKIWMKFRSCLCQWNLRKVT